MSKTMIKNKPKTISVFCFFVFLFFCFAPAFVSAADDDGDLLANEDEAKHYTDSANPDTDGDGYSDGVEVTAGFSPLLGNGKRMHESDHDNDGLNDWLEGWFGSDRGKTDTDGDGYLDYDEIMFGYSPTDPAPVKKFRPRIEVDKTLQHLAVYVDTVKVMVAPVSTGNPSTETPSGTFSVIRKEPVKRYVGPGYNLPGVKWNLEFKRGYYLHTAYWHDYFGKRTNSHGCVNMREADAEKLYRYFSEGAEVTVIGTTPRRMWVGT